MMFKPIAFSFGRRLYLLRYSKALTPLLGNLTSSASITSWQSARKQQLLAGTNKGGLKIPSATNSAEASGKIMFTQQQKRSVLELLKVFDESLSANSMLSLLVELGWMMQRRESQRRKLERESSNQESAFIRLLNCIADKLSQLQCQELALVAWGLGRTRAHNHPLVKACENEIISRGIGTFECRSVSQILWGFSKLHMERSKIFGEVEKTILCRELNLADLDVRGIAQTIMAFAATENGSPDLFELFLEHILTRDFSSFHNFDVTQIAWSFASREAEASQLFEKIEKELFRRNVASITKGVDLAMLLWAFATAKKGSDALFSAIEMQILNLTNISHFSHGDLSNTIWALGKAGRTCEIVFERLEREVKRRGIETFSSENCEILMQGLGYAGRELSIEKSTNDVSQA